MDLDFWASRVHSTKHFSAVQAGRFNHSDSHLIMDASEDDDDVRAWFPCPFCYVEIEVPVLCTHLQEEHCFDLRNAVCPICAANLGKDAIAHFTSCHAHSVKRRRKSQKSGSWNNAPSIPRELSLFIGPNLANRRGNEHETAPDPLLSPFLCNIQLSDTKLYQEDPLPCDTASTTSEVKSTKSSALEEEAEEEDCKEKRRRAAFAQQLILSTIF